MKFIVFYLQLINSLEGLGMFFSSAVLTRRLRNHTATTQQIFYQLYLFVARNQDLKQHATTDIREIEMEPEILMAIQEEYEKSQYCHDGHFRTQPNPTLQSDNQCPSFCQTNYRAQYCVPHDCPPPLPWQLETETEPRQMMESRPVRNNGRNFSGIRALTVVKISHRSRY